MVNHKITAGLSKICRKEMGSADTLPSKGAAGVLDFLISTPAILAMVIESSRDMLDPLLPGGIYYSGEDHKTVS